MHNLQLVKFLVISCYTRVKGVFIGIDEHLEAEGIRMDRPSGLRPCQSFRMRTIIKLARAQVSKIVHLVRTCLA